MKLDKLLEVLYSPKEAAEMCQVDISTILKEFHEGHLKGYQRNQRVIRFTKKQLEQWRKFQMGEGMKTPNERHQAAVFGLMSQIMGESPCHCGAVKESSVTECEDCQHSRGEVMQDDLETARRKENDDGLNNG